MSAAGTVIVGAGQAGFQAAASLREAGERDPILLLGEEAALPYQRPPLSKAYLAGKTDAAGLLLRPAAYLAEHRIAHRGGARVSAIDRRAQAVALADGTRHPYDRLVLATGARNRPLPVPGAGLPGVMQLRSLADADALRGSLAATPRIVVIGAGFIGLEFAAVCAGKGLAVTVVEALDRVMARALSAEMSAWFRTAHESAGIAFRFGAGVQAIEAHEGRAGAVLLADGERLDADLVLVGIGVLPNQDLAVEAGLAARDGIEVDVFLATADPAIAAIGDCARFPSRFARGLPGGERVRLESVQNALDQGRCLAARFAGRPAAYDAVPWFWSDQGPHKLQIAGLAAPEDAAIRRGAGDAFSVFRFRDGMLCAVESVNRPGDHMAARRLLANGRPLTPAQAEDASFDLKAWAMAPA